MFFDTHAHLDLPPLAGSEDAVLRRAREAGVTDITTIGIDPDSSAEAVAIAHRHAGVYAAVGLHPHDASRFSDDALLRLTELSRCDKVVAIGETGLDFFRDRSPRDAQCAGVPGADPPQRCGGQFAILHGRQGRRQLIPS